MWARLKSSGPGHGGNGTPSVTPSPGGASGAGDPTEFGTDNPLVLSAVKVSGLARDGVKQPLPVWSPVRPRLGLDGDKPVGHGSGGGDKLVVSRVLPSDNVSDGGDVSRASRVKRTAQSQPRPASP